MRKRWHKRMVFIAPLAILAMVAFGFVVMYLWNWLAPLCLRAIPSIIGRHGGSLY